MTLFSSILLTGTDIVFRDPFTDCAETTSKASNADNGPQTFHRYNDLPKELKEMIVSYALDSAVEEPSTVFRHAATNRSNLASLVSAKLGMHVLSQALSNSSNGGDELIAPLKQLDRELSTRVKLTIAMRQQYGHELRSIQPHGHHTHHIRAFVWRMEAKLDEIQEAQRRLGCTLEDIEYLRRTRRDAKKELELIRRSRASEQ